MCSFCSPLPVPFSVHQDVLGLKLNRVSLAPDTSGLPPGASLLPQHQKKGYDVDDKDFFWEAAGALPFPKVCNCAAHRSIKGCGLRGMGWEWVQQQQEHGCYMMYSSINMGGLLAGSNDIQFGNDCICAST